MIRKPWTPHDDKVIRASVGKSVSQVAYHLRRNKFSLMEHARSALGMGVVKGRFVAEKEDHQRRERREWNPEVNEDGSKAVLSGPCAVCQKETSDIRCGDEFCCAAHEAAYCRMRQHRERVGQYVGVCG